jgi:hypothetical protein
MSTIKSILGYVIAGLAVPLVLITFINMNGWMQIVGDAGLRISPWITGDEVASTIRHDGYETRIHKPVFMGLLWETREGFVQVDWSPRETAPAVIDETIDYDNNGAVDFRLLWNTSTGEIALTPYSENVLYLEGKYSLREAWAVRVRIKNPGE